MDAKKLLLSGIAAAAIYFIVSSIFSAIRNMFFPYEIFSLPGIRPITDPLMMLFFLHPFVLSFAMAYVYQLTEKKFDGDWKHKGIKFGFMTWILAGLPSAFLVFTSMNYPIGFTIDNFVGTFFAMMAMGLTIAKIYEK